MKTVSSKLISGSAGFSLLEIILVLAMTGVVVAGVTPFATNVLSNIVEGRQLAQRADQGSLALERFVRDVRASDPNNNTINGLQMTLVVGGNDIIYEISGDNLTVDGDPMARYLVGERSGFSEASINGVNGEYPVITMTLVIEVRGGSFELSASAVPRKSLL